MLNDEQIRGNWNEIRNGIRNLWGKLTEDEIDQTSGNLQAVSGIVQERYGEDPETIQDKLNRLLNSFDNETDRNLIKNDHQTSYLRNPTSSRDAH